MSICIIPTVLAKKVLWVKQFSLTLIPPNTGKEQRLITPILNNNTQQESTGSQVSLTNTEILLGETQRITTLFLNNRTQQESMASIIK